MSRAATAFARVRTSLAARSAASLAVVASLPPRPPALAAAQLSMDRPTPSLVMRVAERQNMSRI